MRRTYRTPPIEEALCEVRFYPGKEWGVLFPLQIFESIQDAYPLPPRQQNLVEAGFQLGQPAGEGAEQALMVRGTARTQFVSEDEHRLVSVSPDVLTVHDLRPYSGWEQFLPRIRDAFDAYVAAAQPTSVRRIGM